VDQELRRAVEGSIPDLLPYPGLGRVPGDVDLDDSAGAEFHDDEDVEGLEADGLLDAEVAHPDGIGLVLEEGAPGLRWLTGLRRLHHVLADGGRGVGDPELQFQLEGDTVLPVLGVVGGDAPDECDVPAVDGGPARLGPAGPVLAEPLLLPRDHSLRLDDDECVGPIGEVVLESGPEQAVRVGQVRSRPFTFVDRELLAQGQILHCQSGSVGKEGLYEGEHHLHQL